MKNKTKLISKILLITITIFLLLSFIVEKISNAGDSININDKVNIHALWSKYNDKYDVYCVEEGKNFSEDTEYTVTNKVTFDSENSSMNSANDIENAEIAYILAYNNGKDTALSEDEMETIAKNAGYTNIMSIDGTRRPIFHMMYDVTSVKNNAIWKVKR